MANKKVSQLTSKPAVNLTDLFLIADPTSGQAFKTTISDLGTAIGSGVSSVNTLVGAVVLDTDDIQELASPTNRWFTDTRARAALSAGTGISYDSGTGVITNAVTSGQIATALGYTPANDSLVVKLAGTQTITGDKTFTLGTRHEAGLILKQNFATVEAGYSALAGVTNGIRVGIGATIAHDLIFSGSTSYTYTFPNATGTIALTSNLSSYLPLTGGTLTGDLTLSSGNPRLYFTDTDNNPDYFISNTDGTFTVYDVTNSTSRLTISTLNTILNTNLRVNGDVLINQDSVLGGVSGYTAIASDTDGIFLKLGTASAHAYLVLSGLTNYRNFTFPDATGTLALTSDLSAYLPLTGGVLSGSIRSTGYYLTGMTSGSGALYYSSGSNRVTVANYNASGIVTFEVNGGSTALTLNSNLSATFASTLSATGATLTGALSGTSATFTGDLTSNGELRVSNANGLTFLQLVNSSSGGRNFTLISSGASNPHGIAAGNFYLRNSSTSANPLIIDGGTGAATFSSSVMVVGNGRNVTINGGVDIKGDAGGWATQHGFSGSGGTDLGGFGANGSGNSLTSYYIGTQGTPRIFITSAGNVGIGTTSPTARLQISANAGVDVLNVAGYDVLKWDTGDILTFGGYKSSQWNVVALATGGTERMRITSGGHFKASSTGNYTNVNGTYHELRTGSNDNIIVLTNIAASPFGPNIYFSTASPNNTSNYFLVGGDSTNDKFFIYSNGSILNRTGTYGTISDVKFKENIVDATPKLGDLTKLKVRNFNLKGESTKQIGFIAQEFEQVFPNMIDVSTERGTDGETYKSIKTSVLVPMLVKAIQELNDKITILENK